MDGADIRRDQPTANAKWGNSLSVLLGDCLFAHALRLAAAYGDPTICLRIADASAEVCSGEIIQTQRRYDLNLSTAEYYRVIEMKTAALFAVACELGAYISKADQKVIDALKAFGSKIGVAYQIYDDCLDLAAPRRSLARRSAPTSARASLPCRSCSCCRGRRILNSNASARCSSAAKKAARRNSAR